jgi:hypothetical protein
VKVETPIAEREKRPVTVCNFEPKMSMREAVDGITCNGKVIDEEPAVNVYS